MELENSSSRNWHYLLLNKSKWQYWGQRVNGIFHTTIPIPCSEYRMSHLLKWRIFLVSCKGIISFWELRCKCEVREKITHKEHINFPTVKCVTRTHMQTYIVMHSSSLKSQTWDWGLPPPHLHPWRHVEVTLTPRLLSHCANVCLVIRYFPVIL